MDLHEFTKKYRYSRNNDKGGLEVLPYYDFEKNIMDNLLTEQKLAIAKGRQMHITTLLATYVAWNLLKDNGEINIAIISNKLETSNNLLKKARSIIYYHNNIHNEETNFEKNTERKIIYNGNQLIAGGDLDVTLRGTSFDIIILEEAAFIEDRNGFSIDNIPPSFKSNGQLIAASTPNGINNGFCKMFHNPTYKDLRFTWRDNPRYDEKWVENMKKLLNDNLKFREEIEAEFIDHEEYKEQKKKNNLVQVRLDDEMMKQIGFKLIEKDTNISNYIRGLINEDIKN